MRVCFKPKKGRKKDRGWKEKNEQYLFELQKFLDRAENIKDQELRESIIYQMLKCDNLLTEICEQMLEEAFYQDEKLGYKI